MTFDALLTHAAAVRGSDVHLRAGQPPLIRINGELTRMEGVGALSATDLDGLAARLLNPAQAERLERDHEVDVAWQIPNVGRCRASVFRQRNTTGLALRLIPAKIPPLDTLGMPPAVAALANESRGLIVVTGAIAAGKSEYGMQTFDQSILALVQEGHVSVDEAVRWVTNVDEFTMRLRGITPGSRG